MTYTFRFAPVFSRIDQMFDGLLLTLWLTGIVIVAGFALGVAGALAAQARAPWPRAAVRAYVEAIRNTPLLAQLFFVYFGLPGLGLRLDAMTAGILTLVVNLGAYTTEIARGGIDAVPRGQVDAGTALGLTPVQVFFLIVLKPALKTMFPALTSQFTLLMLASSILSQIGVTELFHMASLIDSATYRSFEVYAVVCGFYLALALLFRLLFAAIYRVVFNEFLMFRQFGLNELLMLLSGLRWTIGLTLLAFAGSFALGLLLLIPRVARSRPLRWAASGWIQAVQGTPLLGLLFVAFFALPLFGWDVSKWVAATLALSIYGSAFLADIWRGAVEAIPSGQWEASAALGLTRWRQLRLVVLPQAFTIAIPPTVGFLVQLIKNTSLASVIGVIELSREAQLVNGATFAPFLVYGCVCVLYFVLCYPLTAWSRTLEVRLAR